MEALIHKNTGVVFTYKPGVMCEKEGLPNLPIINMEIEELERSMTPEDYAKLEKHLQLQLKCREVIAEARIDLYLGELMSMDRFFERFQDSIFWDIGCSEGMWSIVALYCGAKQVYGFDPLAGNKVNSDRFKRYQMKIDNKHKMDTFVSTQIVDIPDIIKIDVEGEELEVLKGAEKTIREYRPSLCIEAHNVLYSGTPERTVTGNLQKVVDLLTEWGFSGLEIEDQHVKDVGAIYHVIYLRV